MAMPSLQELKTIRIDHTGALRAPKRLRDAAAKNKRGELPDDELAALRESVIEEIIRKQEAVGLPIVTDGELRRRGFQDSFNAAVEGFDPGLRNRPSHKNVTSKPFVRTEPAGTRKWRVLSKLKLVKNLVLEEYRLGSKVATRPIKVTLIGPDRIAASFDAEGSRDAYSSVEEFLADVVAIEREIIRQVAAAGCRYVQIDEPGYTSYVDAISIAKLKARGEDPDKVMERSIKADNDIIAGFDETLPLGVFLHFESLTIALHHADAHLFGIKVSAALTFLGNGAARANGEQSGHASQRENSVQYLHNVCDSVRCLS